MGKEALFGVLAEYFQDISYTCGAYVLRAIYSPVNQFGAEEKILAICHERLIEWNVLQRDTYIEISGRLEKNSYSRDAIYDVNDHSTIYSCRYNSKGIYIKSSKNVEEIDYMYNGSEYQRLYFFSEGKRKNQIVGISYDKIDLFDAKNRKLS